MVQMSVPTDQRDWRGNAADKLEGPLWDAANDWIAYNEMGGTPWHKMGENVHGLMTAGEALKVARLDWEVVTRPIGVRIGTSFLTDKRMQAVMREDAATTDHVFAYTSKAYKPLQNREALSFFDTLVGEGEAVLEIAGYLDGGRRVWLLAMLPKNRFEPVRGDVVDDYLLLMNSHDASSSVRLGETPIRAVCRNTLNRAMSQMRDNEFNVRINHIGNVADRLTQAAAVLGKHQVWFASWKEEVAEMVNRSFRAAEAEQFVLDLVQADRIRTVSDYKVADSVSDLKERQRGIADKLLELVESGQGTKLSGVQGSGWGLYNAVTEYVDHFALDSYRGKPSDRPKEDRQLEYLLAGNGARMKERARAWVLEGREAALAI